MAGTTPAMTRRRRGPDAECGLMNLFVRLVWMLLTLRARGPFTPPDDVSRVPLIVFPNDLDINFHVNNGRYLTLMDIGRLDMFIRSGLLRAALKRGWRPVLAAGKIRFRHEMRAFQRFTVETRVVYWNDVTVVMEHRCVIDHPRYGRTAAAVALMRGGFYDRKAKAFVPIATMLEAAGLRRRDPPPASDEVAAFLAAEDALKRAG
jgi:acyl-CoA thioesterase FadM